MPGPSRLTAICVRDRVWSPGLDVGPWEENSSYRQECLMGGTFAKFRMPSSRQSRIDSLRLVMERKRTIVLSFTITILLILTALTVLNTLRSGDSTTVVEELQEEQVSWPEYETWPNWASVSQNTFTVLFPTYKRNDILGRVLHFHCNFALVDRVIVVWNDVDEPTIPENFINYNCSKELFFKRPLVNSVNNRFIPYPEIRTEGMNSLLICSYNILLYNYHNQS